MVLFIFQHKGQECVVFIIKTCVLIIHSKTGILVCLNEDDAGPSLTSCAIDFMKICKLHNFY
jgi:hypothetical protein